MVKRATPKEIAENRARGDIERRSNPRGLHLFMYWVVALCMLIVACMVIVAIIGLAEYLAGGGWDYIETCMKAVGIALALYFGSLFAYWIVVGESFSEMPDPVYLEAQIPMHVYRPENQPLPWIDEDDEDD